MVVVMGKKFKLLQLCSKKASLPHMQPDGN